MSPSNDQSGSDVILQTDAEVKDIGYTMSHSNFITVRAEDPDGNKFCVRNDGSQTVTLSQQYEEKMKNLGNVAGYGKVSKINCNQFDQNLFQNSMFCSIKVGFD